MSLINTISTFFKTTAANVLRHRFMHTIGFQLISIISLIIILSLTVVTWISTGFFRRDNEVRIKENNLKIADVISRQVKTDMVSLLKMSRLAASSLGGEGHGVMTRDDFFRQNPTLVYIGVYRGGGKQPTLQNGVLNRRFSVEKGVSYKKIKEAVAQSRELIQRAFAAETTVSNVSPFFDQPMVCLTVPYIQTTENKARSVLVILVSMDRFLASVDSPGIVKTYIVNGRGELLIHHDRSLVAARADFSDLPIVKTMMTSPMDNAQLRYRDEQGTRYIGAFKKIELAGMGVVAQVDEEKAFAAVVRMQRRNIYITLMILATAILIVYFFTKTLTRPVNVLVDATRRIEKGEYDIHFRRYAPNEIGTLSRSFVSMGQGLAEREKMKDAFGKFVNKELAEQVLKGEIRLGGERKEAAVFFSDIRSFTAISESLQPEEVVAFLNDYMSRMVSCVNQTKGVVDKYIGDAIMAIWGAPVSHGNDTENAVNGALMMRASLMEFNQGRGGAKKPIIKIGCGINCGPLIAGQIGSQERMEYTVIGDTVNLASRIEGLNKPFGTDILISSDAYERVKDTFHMEAMRPIKVKGKTKPQQIYAVLGRRDDPQSPKTAADLRQILGTSDKGLKDFDGEAKEEKFEIVGEPAPKKTKKRTVKRGRKPKGK